MMLLLMIRMMLLLSNNNKTRQSSEITCLWTLELPELVAHRPEKLSSANYPSENSLDAVGFHC